MRTFCIVLPLYRTLHNPQANLFVTGVFDRSRLGHLHRGDQSNIRVIRRLFVYEEANDSDSEAQD